MLLLQNSKSEHDPMTALAGDTTVRIPKGTHRLIKFLSAALDMSVADTIREAGLALRDKHGLQHPPALALDGSGEGAERDPEAGAADAPSDRNAKQQAAVEPA